MKSLLPTHAIVAVTLNCNSHCLMCDIWKNNHTHELRPADYLKLPTSLVDINITGGEPFLRSDLPEIVKNIKIAAPKAKLIISTNGFLTTQIKKITPQLMSIDPNITYRISIDGWEKTHNSLRQIPGAFKTALSTINFLKKIGVKDLGIGFTIMENNYSELFSFYQYAKKEGFDLSLSLVSESPIYFGPKKQLLRPQDTNKLTVVLNKIIFDRICTLNPKNWSRAWFEHQLLVYIRTGKRALPCSAANNLFYLDSAGDIFPCQLKDKPLGNLLLKSFADIWNSPTTAKIRQQLHSCQSCWMVCSVKPTIPPLFIFNRTSVKH